MIPGEHRDNVRIKQANGELPWSSDLAFRSGARRRHSETTEQDWATLTRGTRKGGVERTRLENKVAVITGAGSGIGRHLAIRFAEEGALVCLADINCEAACALERELGSRAMAVEMDVADELSVELATAMIAQRFGHIDVLVSNAGLQHIAPIADLEFADWKRVLAVHLDGAFLTARAALRYMSEDRRGGSVIFMGSVHSKEASKLKAPYVAAKHGILGLCRVLAKEGAAHNVRANVICPGYIRTPLVEKQIPEQARELGINEDDVVRRVFLKDTVDGEFSTVEDVAETAIFLSAFPSNALTGQSILVSHGWHMD